MKLGTAVRSMKKPVRDAFTFTDDEMASGVSSALLRPFKRILLSQRSNKNALVQTKLFVSKGGSSSVSRKVALTKRPKSNVEYLGSAKSRRSGGGRPIEYGDIYDKLDD
jgi:hypothetical protein